MNALQDFKLHFEDIKFNKKKIRQTLLKSKLAERRTQVKQFATKVWQYK